MEPIKQSLVEAAGNLDVSADKVQRRVLANLNQRKRKLPRFVPVVVIAAVLLVLAFTIPLNNDSKELVTSTYTEEEQLKFLYKIMNEAHSSNPEEFKFSFIAEVAYPYYAKELNIQVDEAYLKEWSASEFERENDKETYKAWLENNPDADKIENIQIPRFYQAQYLEKLLIEKYEEMYPSFYGKVETLMKYDAIKYFSKFTAAASMFASTSEYQEILGHDEGENVGTVIDVTNDSVTIAIDANYLDIAHLSVEQIASFKKVVKVPQKNKKFKLGEYVRIKYFRAPSGELGKVNIGIASSVEQYFMTATFPLNKEDANTFLDLIKDLPWEPVERTHDNNELSYFVNNELYSAKYELGQLTLYKDNEMVVVPVDLTNAVINVLRNTLPSYN